MIAAINLLPVPRRRARAARVRARVWALVCTAVAFGLMAGYTTLSSAESGDRARLERAVATVGHRAETLEHEVGEAKARNGEVSRKLSTTRAMVDHPDWSVLLDLLSHARGEQVMLEKVTLRTVEPPKDAKPSKGAQAPAPEAYTVHVAGLAASPADVMMYVALLEKTGLFDSVKPPETRARTQQGRDLVGFEVECAVSARLAESAPRAGGGK